MGKKSKQKPKKEKYEQETNINMKKNENYNKEKKLKKKANKKAEIEKEEKEEDNKKKILRKIYKVKYLEVYVGNEECRDGVEIFRENGEKLDPFDDEAPLYYGDFGFKVDIDTGKILNWSDAKLYAKVNMRVMDTGFYNYLDKDNNKIYEDEGYAPSFLCLSPGEDICFETDVDGYILGWKEENIKEQIIEYLREFLLGESEIYKMFTNKLY